MTHWPHRLGAPMPHASPLGHPKAQGIEETGKTIGSRAWLPSEKSSWLPVPVHALFSQTQPAAFPQIWEPAVVRELHDQPPVIVVQVPLELDHAQSALRVWHAFWVPIVPHAGVAPPF